MKFLIDYREKHILDLLEGVYDEIVLTKLPVGDYMLASDAGGVLVERKTVKDFWTSVRSNRLWDQLLRMMKADRMLGFPVKRRLLLIHGGFEDHLEALLYSGERELSVRWNQLMGACLEIIYVYNTPILQVEDDAAFAAFIITLVKREASGLNDKLPEARWYRRTGKADLPVKENKRYLLSSIPYIGNRLADNLLQHFNTVYDVACASPEDLREVPLIGEKKSELIYRIFHS